MALLIYVDPIRIAEHLSSDAEDLMLVLAEMTRHFDNPKATAGFCRNVAAEHDGSLNHQQVVGFIDALSEHLHHEETKMGGGQ